MSVGDSTADVCNSVPEEYIEFLHLHRWRESSRTLRVEKLLTNIY